MYSIIIHVNYDTIIMNNKRQGSNVYVERQASKKSQAMWYLLSLFYLPLPFLFHCPLHLLGLQSPQVRTVGPPMFTKLLLR